MPTAAKKKGGLEMRSFPIHIYFPPNPPQIAKPKFLPLPPIPINTHAWLLSIRFPRLGGWL